jgi:hypothetical protein
MVNSNFCYKHEYLKGDKEYQRILKDIDFVIENSVQKGKFRAHYLLLREFDHYSYYIIEKLKEDGYKVRYRKKNSYLLYGKDSFPHHYRIEIAWGRFDSLINFLNLIAFKGKG